MRTRIRDARQRVKEQVGFEVEIDFVPAPLSDIGIDSYAVIQAEKSYEDLEDNFFLWYLGKDQLDFGTPEEASEAFVAAWFEFRPPVTISGIH